MSDMRLGRDADHAQTGGSALLSADSPRDKFETKMRKRCGL